MGAANIREISRQAVRDQIVRAAEELFAEQGYDATTVDQIAEQVGMSQRTFFRYLDSKEDLVLARYEDLGLALAERLEARPEDEDPWLSLRRVFDHFVEEDRNPKSRERARAARRAIDSSTTLMSAYLDRMETIELVLTGLLSQRSAGRADAPDWRELRALTGAAFACLNAVTTEGPGSAPLPDLADGLDRLMGGFRPLG